MAALHDRILQADAAIRPQVLESPLEPSRLLSEAFGCEVLLKCDHLQPTGSFKLRGATNRIGRLTPDERRRGVTTSSIGNHGQAVARAGGLAGVPVTVYVAASAASSKMAAIKALGAELVVLEGSVVQDEHLVPVEVAALHVAVARRIGEGEVAHRHQLGVAPALRRRKPSATASRARASSRAPRISACPMTLMRGPPSFKLVYGRQ
jgi:hypothetical protein